jgi:hypothetical protein
VAVCVSNGIEACRLYRAHLPWVCLYFLIENGISVVCSDERDFVEVNNYFIPNAYALGTKIFVIHDTGLNHKKH